MSRFRRRPGFYLVKAAESRSLAPEPRFDRPARRPSPHDGSLARAVLENYRNRDLQLIEEEYMSTNEAKMEWIGELPGGGPLYHADEKFEEPGYYTWDGAAIVRVLIVAGPQRETLLDALHWAAEQEHGEVYGALYDDLTKGTGPEPQPEEE